ncbi:lymphocyte antigen 86 [Lissotriton helveticus]
MKVFTAVLCFVLLLMASLIENKEWPVHTVCKTGNLEVSYKSCDPVQDLGFSFEPCFMTPSGIDNMKLAILLRRDVNVLFFRVNGYIKKLNVFSAIYTFCSLDYPIYTFCGAKKGELFLYDGPQKLGIKELPQGDYVINLDLYNEDEYLIACANITIFSR